MVREDYKSAQRDELIKNMVFKQWTITNKLAMDKHAKIYVAGHRGLVGSALMRQLKEQGYTNLIVRTHAELDLTNQADVEAFLHQKNQSMYF